MESLASSMGPHPDLLLAKIDGEANPVTADKFAKTYGPNLSHNTS